MKRETKFHDRRTFPNSRSLGTRAKCAVAIMVAIVGVLSASSLEWPFGQPFGAPDPNLDGLYRVADKKPFEAYQDLLRLAPAQLEEIAQNRYRVLPWERHTTAVAQAGMQRSRQENYPDYVLALYGRLVRVKWTFYDMSREHPEKLSPPELILFRKLKEEFGDQKPPASLQDITMSIEGTVKEIQNARRLFANSEGDEYKKKGSEI